MQEVSAFHKTTRIKTASLYKLLFWSLAFHLLAIVLFWNEQTSAPLLAGKEHPGKILSIALSPNTSHVTTTYVVTKEKQPQTKESNIQNILTSKSKIHEVVQKPSTHNSQHVARIKPGIASKKKLREISTETAGLLQASLGEKLSEYFHYPRIARKKGWQGQVKLSLRIEGSGHFSNIQLHRSSGHPSLDSAALNSLQKAAYLPDAKSWLHGMHYDIVVPVEYHLIDS